MSALATRRYGDGDAGPVLLVHGAILSSRYSFFRQRSLGERWELIAVDRPGHGDAPPAARGDFEPEAAALADLLAASGRPAHLVGHSYGGIIALLAAAARPELVLSATAIEPPAWGVALDDPRVAETDTRLRALFERPPADDRELLAAFFARVGADAPVPDPLPEPLARGARMFRVTRHPGEAELPLDALAAAPFPLMLVSGGHSPAFEAVADRIAARTGARREVVTGAKHLIPDVGERFNAVLEDFLRGAEAARA